MFSSRKIARRLEADVAFRVLAAGNFPAHRTLSEFRRVHLSELTALFVQVVRLAREAGLAKLGRVGIDGTKANASKHKAMSYARMREREKALEAEIEALTRRAAAEDKAEDREYGTDHRGDELPRELPRRQDRLEGIRAAKQRLEARQREHDAQAGRDVDDDGNTRDPGGKACKRAFGEVPAKAQDNFTDPETRIMKTGHGFEQSYNAQAAVDEHSQLILATEVGNNASDSQRLIPVIEAVQRNTGATPEMILADAGYASEAKAPKQPTSDTRPATQRMAQRLATPEGKAHYRRRKVIPEPVFGWIKQAIGFRTLSLRGLEKVTGEWHLVCLASNLRRMHRLGWQAG